MNILPDGWEEVELLKYIELVKSGVKPFKGKKKYIDTGSIETGKILRFIDVNFESRPSRANMEVEENDVLFAKMKNTEKIYLISKIDANNLYSTGFAILRIKDKLKLIPEYIYFWLRTKEFQSKKNKECTGATQKAINETKLKKFKIIIPSLKIQKKIVIILKKNDELLKRCVYADELTNQLIQSVFYDMFGDPIKNDKKWEMVKLNEVFNEMYRYPTFYGFKYVPKGVPVLKISNMLGNGKFIENIEHYDKIPKEISKKYPRTIVINEDIVLEVRGTYIGKCALVSPFLVGANVSPNAMRLSPNRKKIDSNYFIYLTFTDGWKTQIKKMVNYWKGGFGTIKSSDLKILKIPLPPLSIQQKFACIVEKTEAIRNNQKHDRHEINNLFDALIQKAFNGELK